MAFELTVNGETHRYVLEAIGPAFIPAQERSSAGPGTKVVLHRQKKAGLEFVDLISANPSRVEGAKGLKPGEFYLRDYN